MGSLFVFTFRASMVLLALVLVYKVLLAREKQLRFNRALLMSFFAIAPLTLALADAGSRMAAYTAADPVGGLTPEEFLAFLSGASDVVATGIPATSLWLAAILIVWIAGMVVLAMVTAAQWLRIRRIIATGTRTATPDGHTLCIVPDAAIAPFSFGHTIVINSRDYLEAAPMIIAHESRHIQAAHWLDLMIARIATIIAWYNPAMWIITEELKTIHEYQADQAVIAHGADARSYQLLLIKKAVGRSFPAIANSLNHSNLKKRITMMLKSSTRKGRLWRALALVPAAGLVITAGNIPAVAHAMSAMAATDISAAVSARKDTQNSQDTKKLSGTIVSITSTGTASTDAAISGPSAENMEIYVNGHKVEQNAVNAISPDEIASITIDKKESTDGKTSMNITLKKEAPASENQIPTFKGGEAAMFKWLCDNIKFPEEVDKEAMKEPVRIVVRVSLDKDGHVVSTSLIKSGDEPFNKEALRVASLLPDFNPAIENGQPVASNLALPIVFSAK